MIIRSALYQTNTPSASSMKQQSAGRHVASLGHINPIPSQPVFDLASCYCVLSREAANTIFIVQSGLKPRTLHSRQALCPLHHSCGSVGFKVAVGAVMVVIVRQLDLQLPMQSVSIPTKVVNFNPVHGEVKLTATIN